MRYRTSLAIWLLLGPLLVGPWLAATVLAEEDVAPDQQMADSKVVFEKNCASCHGKDGRAKTLRAKFNDARDLSQAQWQDTISDAAILQSIESGRGKMPPFADKLGAAQRENLVRYVRGLKQ